MIIGESRRGRRLVGRLDRGADLLEALTDACRARDVRAGEVRAVGALEQAVLSQYDQRARVLGPPRRFDAQLEIVSLTGNVSEQAGKLIVVVHVALSRERDNGIELVGGRLVAGRVFAVEFVIDSFDDLILRRAPDAQTGLSLWKEAIALGPPGDGVAQPAPHPSSAPSVPFEAPARGVEVPRAGEPQSPPPAWREVVEASATGEPAPDEDIQVAPGDFIDHPKFGRCQVERIEGDYEFISARLRNQRLIRLSLDVITLVHVGNEEGHQLFRAVPGAR